ncbi:methyltransferase [Streptomyces sp. NPDC055078]
MMTPAVVTPRAAVSDPGGDARPQRAAAAEFTRVFSTPWVALGLSALVEVGAVEALADGPLEAGRIAERTACDPGALTRFLRAGCASGVFSQPAPGTFALTEMGRVLLPDAPGSLHGLLRLLTTEEFLRPWTAAAHTLRTGRPAFDSVYGMPMYDYVAGRPALAELFQRAMNTSTATDVLLAAHDFSGDRHIVDVGGGHGALLAAVLAEHRQLTGTLFDLPHVVGSAGEVLERAGVAGRCALSPGSFFEQVPGGGDVYLLSRVLHNWDDDDTVRILRSVREAMPGGAHALIVGLVPDPGDRTAIIPAVDLMVLTMFGGHNRGRADFAPLLARAGLREHRFIHHPDTESVLDVVAL